MYDERKKIKNKIKSYCEKINTNFHDNTTPKEGCDCAYLSVILLDSVFKMGISYYPQVFLEKYKHFVKEKILGKFNNDELEVSPNKSDESDESDVD